MLHAVSLPVSLSLPLSFLHYYILPFSLPLTLPPLLIICLHNEEREREQYQGLCRNSRYFMQCILTLIIRTVLVCPHYHS